LFTYIQKDETPKKIKEKESSPLLTKEEQMIAKNFGYSLDA